MRSIKIKLKKKAPDSYSIFIENNSSLEIIKFLRKEFAGSVCVIITDNTVRKLYGEKLRALIEKKNRQKAFLFSIPVGELSKSQKYKTIIEEKMLNNHIDRHSVIIALGGGVVGDLAGFIASTYRRGIPYIQIPTTLLAMVDSSIGGKTGINTPQGKNLIGSFLQPKAIFVNLKYLETLPQKQFVNGLVEAVKVFITSDASSFAYVEKNIDLLLGRNPKVLEKVIRSAMEIKARIIERDERESGERMILNFGHTIGHSIEKLSKYKMLHGYAVALGIIVEASIAVSVGKLSKLDYLRIKELLVNKFGINLKHLYAFKSKEILDQTKGDKKNRNGKSHYVVLKNIGEVYVEKNNFAFPIEDIVVDRVLKDINLQNNF